MLLEYSTPEAASFAVEKLNGFEYPINEPIMMKPEKGWLVSLIACKVAKEYFYPYMCIVLRKQSSAPMADSLGERKRGYSTMSSRSTGNDLDYHASDKLALITSALEEATSIMKSHGLVPGSLLSFC